MWDGKLVEEVVDRLGIEKMDGGKRGRKRSGGTSR